MSLRDDQRSSTRERIIAAAAELVRESQSIEVAMTAVAARAGVGERTVYRYFATKLELFQALFNWMTKGANELPPSPGASGLIERTEAYYAAYQEQPELIRALSAARTGSDLRAARAEERRQSVRDALADEIAGLAEPRRTQVLAAVHLLTSSDAFLHGRDFWDLDADAMVDLVRWAVPALLAAADAPAPKKGKR